MQGLALAVGILSAGLLALSAPWISAFFREPRLENIAYAWTPALLITALAQVPQGILRRDFLYARRAGVMVASAILASAIAITLAFQGFGYWALVIQAVGRAFFLFVFSSVAARLMLLPQINLPFYRKIFTYTSNLTLFQFINYFHRNLDNILIGRFLGAVQLGYYTRAYSLLQVFNSSLSGVITPVLHSAMARKQDDLPALRRAYGEVVSKILWISAPAMGLAAALAPEVIRLVWGPGWENAETPFFWLALAGMHQGVYGTLGTVFMVRYKTKELIICGATTTLLYGAAIAYGLSGGIEGVAQAYSIMSWLLFLPLMAYIWIGIMGGNFRQIVQFTWKPIVVGFALLAGMRYVIDKISML